MRDAGLLQDVSDGLHGMLGAYGDGLADCEPEEVRAVLRTAAESDGGAA